jgi:hypothetical protein
LARKAEVTNAGESARQNVLEKPAQKFLMTEGHHAALAAMRIILPAKRHVSIGYVYTSMKS